MNKFLTPLAIALVLAFPSASGAAWDVTVSTDPSGVGDWASDGSGGQVFTPSGDNANVNIAEIVSHLGTGPVTVRTDGNGGTDPGLLTVQGTMTLPGTSLLTLRGSDLQINANIEGPGALALVADDATAGTPDEVTIGSSVTLGSYLPGNRLDSFAVTATTFVANGSVYTTGSQTYAAKVQLSQTLGAFSRGGGNVTFTNGIEGKGGFIPTYFTVEAPTGTVRLSGNVGDSNSTYGFSITAATTELGGTMNAMYGASSIYGNLTLTSDTTFNGTTLTTYGTVSGAHRLNVYSTNWERYGAVNVKRVDAWALTNLGSDPAATAIHATERVDASVRGQGTVSSDGPVTIRQVGSTGGQVTVNSPGVTTLSVDGGYWTPFHSFTTDAAGTNLIEGTFTPGTKFDLNGATTLKGNTTINGAGVTTLDSLAGGGRGYTSASSSTPADLGTVSGTFSTFAVSGAGAQLGGAVNASGSIVVNAPLAITNAMTFASSGDSVSTGTSLSGAFPVTVSSNASGLNHIGGIGVPAPPSIAATGPTRVSNDLHLTGNVAVTGTLRLDDDVDVTSDAGTISASGAVQLGTTGTSVHEVTGATQFAGGLSGVGTLRKTGSAAMTVAGTSTATGRIEVVAGELAVTGTHTSLGRLDLTDGTVSGTGTLPDLTASAGSVRPGNASGVGTLATGDLRFVPGSELEIVVTGGTAAALSATGTVNLAGATLDLSGAESLTVGQPQVIITNDGTDSVSETFDEFDHGTVVEVSEGVRVRVNYRGGDGNDVSLHRVLASSTALAVSAPTSSVGDNVTLTATVTGIVSTPGAVRFYRGGLLLGAVQPTGGLATLTLSSLPLGTSTLEARYAGDAGLEASSSNTVQHTVSTRAMPAPDFTPDPVPQDDAPVVPTQPTQPTQPTGDITKPIATIQVAAASLVVTEGAIPKLRTTISCDASEVSCRYATAASIDVRVGKRTVRVPLASRTTQLAGGAARTILIPLGIRARAQLARAGSLRVRLVTRVIDAANNQASPDTRFATVRLKRG